MVQQDISPIKRKIMNFIENNGPSLPAHIATEIGQSMLFSSAFLAELLSEKKLVISHMKVGSSPVYFIVGQESLLEKYSVHIKGKPGEAYALLKENKFLKDSEQLPAIRVALRSIKDFAKPFKFKEEIYWRYLTNGVEEFLSEKNEEANGTGSVNMSTNSNASLGDSTSTGVPTGAQEPVAQVTTGAYPKGTKTSSRQEPVAQVSTSAPTGVSTSDDEGDSRSKVVSKAEPRIEEKSEKIKKSDEGEEKSEKVLDIYDEDALFIDKVREFLKKKKIVVLEETEVKKREFLGRGRIQSDIGELEILIIGKDKKNIIDKDVENAMAEAVNKKMLILFLSTGEVAKKAKDLYREHKNLIRFVRI